MPDTVKKTKHTALYHVTLVTFYEYIPPYIPGDPSDFTIDKKLNSTRLNLKKWHTVFLRVNLKWERKSLYFPMNILQICNFK